MKRFPFIEERSIKCNRQRNTSGLATSAIHWRICNENKVICMLESKLYTIWLLSPQLNNIYIYIFSEVWKNFRNMLKVIQASLHCYFWGHSSIESHTFCKKMQRTAHLPDKSQKLIKNKKSGYNFRNWGPVI